MLSYLRIESRYVNKDKKVMDDVTVLSRYIYRDELEVDQTSAMRVPTI